MTLRRWRVPFAVAAGLVLLAWALGRLPQDVVNVVRLSNGFFLLAGLIWLIQRVLSYEALLVAHRRDILGIVSQGELLRKDALEELKRQTAEIASGLARETTRQADELAKLAEQRHAVISEKIDTVIGRTPEPPSGEHR